MTDISRNVISRSHRVLEDFNRENFSLQTLNRSIIGLVWSTLDYWSARVKKWRIATRNVGTVHSITARTGRRVFA